MHAAFVATMYDANYLCENINQEKATFLHPEKSISEELRQGEEVFVVLTNKM